MGILINAYNATREESVFRRAEFDAEAEQKVAEHFKASKTEEKEYLKRREETDQACSSRAGKVLLPFLKGLELLPGVERKLFPEAGKALQHKFHWRLHKDNFTDITSHYYEIAWGAAEEKTDGLSVIAAANNGWDSYDTPHVAVKVDHKGEFLVRGRFATADDDFLSNVTLGRYTDFNDLLMLYEGGNAREAICAVARFIALIDDAEIQAQIGKFLAEFETGPEFTEALTPAGA